MCRDSPVFGESQKRVMTVGGKTQFTPFDIFLVRARGSKIILNRTKKGIYMLKEEPAGLRLLKEAKEPEDAVEVGRRKKRFKYIVIFKTVLSFVFNINRILAIINKIYEWFVDFF